MKKLTLCMMAIIMSFTFISTSVTAATDLTPTSIADPKMVDARQADALLERLNEIKAMDKSNLSSVEKKQLRKETRAIKSQLKEIGGGVYLSVGAIIVILLLLILLL